MKAATVTKPHEIGPGDMPAPARGEDDVIVETLTCGICSGTAAGTLEAHFPDLETYPLVLGHEGVGRVAEMRSMVRRYRMGDMVLRPGLKDRDPAPHDLVSGWGACAEYTEATGAAALRADGMTGFDGVFLSQQVVPDWVDPVDTVGSTSAINHAYSAVANHGKACVYAVRPAPAFESNSSLAPYHWQLEYLILPTFEIGSAVRETVISHVFLGFVKPSDVIDDVGPFADLPNAIGRVLSRSALKSVICGA